MTKVKFCGLSRLCDIEAANILEPEYVGFVFAPGSRRYVSPAKAAELKKFLRPHICAVGVFVNESPKAVAELLRKGTIDSAQLHGGETEEYIRTLRALTDKPIIRAFRVKEEKDVSSAWECSADFLLFDGGSGEGATFDWKLLEQSKRPYFLAGGLGTHNVSDAVKRLRPYAVDVSSGIETDGYKDRAKMEEFIFAVRKEEEQ